MPLVRELRALYPKAPIFVSCTTVAGRELADFKLDGLVDGLFYAPLDYVFCVRRVLRRLRPALVVVLETEIWPNLYRETRRGRAALVIVNGRISDRALPRYQRLRWFFRAPLSEPNAILVQSEQDRSRYIAAGAPPHLVHATGNLKYDFIPGAGEIAPGLQQLLDRLRPAQIWICASTMPPLDGADLDEDDVVIAAFLRLPAPRPLLLLAPRRPERFDEAAAKLERAGISFARRTRLQDAPASPAVILLDTIGELSRLFAIADVVFMGGTLARRGGHNILEPAYFGKCVITGPHMENFAEIAAEFAAADATVSIPDEAALAPAIESLLADAGRRAAIGARAKVIAESKRGVTARVARQLLDFYDDGIQWSRPRPLLAPLSALWSVGVAKDRLRAKPRSLSAPVISVGNITMGGSGKTPFVDWLAAEFSAEGREPAILTRGYGRRSTERTLVLRAGSECPVFRTGDEPQILLRSGHAHIGIGADRYETGTLMERELSPDVFLLDDGFQHWRLHRDLDIVLIDALKPFGGGYVFPRGLLREPLAGLARASVFLITRIEPGVRTEAIERVLHRYNPAAPIFRSRIAPVEWVNAITNERAPVGAPPFLKIAAFCGLGNPRAFWTTLDSLGLNKGPRCNFGDHHHYRPVQIRRLAVRAREAGADALVTTQKDVINMPENLATTLDSTPLWWLRVAVEIEDAAALLKLVSDVVNRSVCQPNR